MSQKHNNNTKIIIDSQNINAIGKVVDKDTNKELSEITQLIMIVNASSKNVQKEIDDLLIAGADPDLEINYYNQQTTARKLALLYRKNIKFP
tara:strand:- start:1148 stop:1423 length:276 start_codon:yes stop_codon:yes gene_type:complete